VDKGTLAEFRLQGDRRLAASECPDGKGIAWFADLSASISQPGSLIGDFTGESGSNLLSCRDSQ